MADVLDEIEADLKKGGPQLKLPPHQPDILDEIAEMAKPQGPLATVGGALTRGIAGAPGMLGDIRELVGKGVEAGGTALGLPKPDPEEVKKASRVSVPVLGAHTISPRLTPPTSPETIGWLESAIGPTYRPRSEDEKWLAAGAEGVPAAMISPTRSVWEMGANAVRYGAVPGLAAEGAGELAHKFTPGYEGPAAMVAALAAPIVGNKVITPRHIDQQRADFASTLRGHGIEPTVGDVSNNPLTQHRELMLNPNLREDQISDFTHRVGQVVGMDTSRLSTGKGGAWTQRFKEMGDRFEDLTRRNVLTEDPQMAQEIAAVHNNYNAIPGIHSPEATAALSGAMTHLRDALRAGSGAMSGADYQLMRRRLNDAAMAAMDSALSGSQDRGHALRDMVDVLDNAMERSIARNNPSDAGAWGAARRDYRNAYVINRALGKGGPLTAQGIVTPENIGEAAKYVYNKRQYLKGNEPFSEFTDPARALLPRMADPTADLAARIKAEQPAVKSIGHFAGTGLGALFGAKAGHDQSILGAIIGGAAGDVAGNLAGMPIRAGQRAVAFNPLYTRWQTNTLVPREGGIPEGYLATQNFVRALQRLEHSDNRTAPP